MFWVSNVKPEGQLTAEHEKTYEEANTLFVSVVIVALTDHLKNVYLRNKTHRSVGCLEQ
jgi:hypothetical protein